MANTIFDFKPIPSITPRNNYWENGTWKFNSPEITAGSAYAPSYIDVILHGVTALTLVNAKEDGLNYLKLFGGTEQLPETYIDSVTLEGKCEQRNLPEGYTQVEYLESSGTQYFNSGVMPNQDTSVEMKAQLFNSSTMRFFAAYATAGGTPYYGVGFSTSGKWVNQTKTSNQVTDVNADTNLHTIYKNKNILYIDGTQIDNSGSGDFTLNYPIYLLAANVGGSTSFISAGKIYYTKIWDNNTLIRNFIPCRRNSDSELGMYDTVNNQFLTNAGSGSFTAGSVAVPSPTTPVDIVCNNGTIKASPNLVNLNTVTNGYYYNASGVYSSADPARLTDYIPVIAGEKYTIFAESRSTATTSFNLRINYFDSSKVWKLQDAQTIAPNTPTCITVTISTSSYIRISANYSGISACNWDTLQIVQGEYTTSTLPVYRPYGSIYYDGTVETVTDSNGLTATAQPLSSVGNYKDTQEVLSGAVTRNVGIKVLDGTERWLKISDQNAYYTSISDMLYCNPVQPGLSNQFIGAGVSTANMPDNSIKLTYTSDNSGAILFKHNDTTTLEDWVQFVTDQYNSGNPIIAIYPLATATTATVSGQQLNKEPVTVTGSLTGLVANVVSSSHTVPTPTQPLDIVANNGVLKYGQYGKNLFDKTLFDTNVGSTITYTTFEIPNGTYTMSTNFPISNNVTNVFIFAGEVTSGAATVTNGVYDEQSQTITVTDGKYTVAYRSTTSSSSNTNNPKDYDFQLELGSTATPYEPYHFGLYYDGTVETVEVTGKNIYDFVNNNALFNSNNGNGWWLDVSNSKIAIGASENNSTWGIPCKPNTTYTVSIPANLTYSGLLRIAWGTMADLSFVNGSTSQPVNIVVGEVNGNYRTATITTGNNATYIFVQIGSAGYYDGTIRNVTQLELGSTATTYEPYYNGGQATAEMLLKVGTYQDEQSVLDGEVTRKIGIKVLDGTENWQNISGYFNISKTSIGSDSTVMPSNTTNIICSHFETKTGEFANGIGVGGNYVNFKYDSIATTLTAWKQYLSDQYNSGNPVVIVYPLATATTESVTGQPLTIQQGTNVVEITQASIDSLELEVSYKAGVEVTVEEIEAVNNDESVEVTING